MKSLNKNRIKKVLLLRLKPPIYDFDYHPIGFRPPYTLKYIEALLLKEAVCAVRLIDQRITDSSFEEVLDSVYSWSPDIIILSVSILDIDRSLEFCQLIKGKKECRNAIIICTGQKLNVDTEKYSAFKTLFDITLEGEAEQRAVSIVKSLNKGISLSAAKSLYGHSRDERKPIKVPDLDSLPFPVYNFDSLKGYSFVYPLKKVRRRLVWGHILSSRGCPHGCIFCSQIMRDSYGKRFRRRSAANVVDEVESLLKSGANIIAFDDDNFTTSEEHIRAICGEIKMRRLNIQWICHARVDELTPPLLKLMKESGCILLRFGIETGSERILSILGKTNDTHSWFDKSKDIVKEARALGISVACLFIVGNPTETINEFRASIHFSRALSPDIVQVAYFTPFPGSKAYLLFKDQLKKIHVSDMYHYKEPLVNLSGMSDSNLKRAQGIFYKAFLMRPGFIASHIFNCMPFYSTNPNIFSRLLGIVKKTLF